jgi:glyoxylase-like metal-dependent hydrolase (beta-lactamase superfamily II)
MESLALPLASDHQAYFHASAVEAGIVSCPGEMFLDPAPKDIERWDAPALCFLLKHSHSGEYLLFDLGIRKDKEGMTPAGVDRHDLFRARVQRDIAERVKDGGLDPGAIKTVIISHAHWDHTGDVSFFPNAATVVGKGTYDLVRNGYPADLNSAFAQNILPMEEGRIRTLDPNDTSLWTPLGPFPRAHDLFGDGSAYIVDAPGHVSGHVNLLARTSADGAWLYCAGDSAHDWRLITGEAKIAGRQGLPGTTCMHRDVEVAEENIAKIKELRKISRVRIVLAHDAPFLVKGEGFWPETIPSL